MGDTGQQLEDMKMHNCCRIIAARHFRTSKTRINLKLVSRINKFIPLVFDIQQLHHHRV